MTCAAVPGGLFRTPRHRPAATTIAAMGSWEEFEAGLTAAFGRLPDGAVLQLYELSRPSDGAFAQVWQAPDRLKVEIAGNDRLASDRRVPDDVERRIGSYGWQPPSEPHPWHWWGELEWPAPAAGYQRFAAGLVGVFRDVHGVPSPDELGYESWVAGSDAPFDVPELGIGALHGANAARVGGRGAGPDPEFRIAGSPDAGRAADGRPVVRTRRLSGAERAGVAAYLRDAATVAVAWGYGEDPFDPERPEQVPLHLHTDGRWIWSESLAYFAARYGIAPQPEFLAHIERNGYRPPEVDEDTVLRAGRATRPA
jgi:hypothetical protein